MCWHLLLAYYHQHDDDDECCRAHNLTLQPTVSLTELLPLIRAAPTAWVGAAGGSPLRDQSPPQSTGVASDRSGVCQLHLKLIIIGSANYTTLQHNHDRLEPLTTRDGVEKMLRSCCRTYKSAAESWKGLLTAGLVHLGS